MKLLNVEFNFRTRNPILVARVQNVSVVICVSFLSREFEKNNHLITGLLNHIVVINYYKNLGQHSLPIPATLVSSEQRFRIELTFIKSRKEEVKIQTDIYVSITQN